MKVSFIRHYAFLLCLFLCLISCDAQNSNQKRTIEHLKQENSEINDLMKSMNELLDEATALSVEIQQFKENASQKKSDVNDIANQVLSMAPMFQAMQRATQLPHKAATLKATKDRIKEKLNQEDTAILDASFQEIGLNIQKVFEKFDNKNK